MKPKLVLKRDPTYSRSSMSSSSSMLRSRISALALCGFMALSSSTGSGGLFGSIFVPGVDGVSLRLSSRSRTHLKRKTRTHLRR